MKEDDKLIDAVIDLGVVLKGMRKDMNHRLKKLEKQQHRTNAELSEIRLTFIQYADAIVKTTEHEKRINRLEGLVLK